MILPNYTDEKWRVSHTADSGADIVDTRNADFSSDKLISLKPKPIVLYTNSDDANFANLLAVVSTESLYYLVTSDGIFSTSLNFPTSPTKLATSGSPNIRLNTDAVAFATYLVVSGDNSIGYYDSSWHSAGISLNTAYPHPICVFENKRQLAVSNGNIVTLYDTSFALQQTLTLPSEYVVVWMRWRANNLYIGTRNITGSGAKMFVYNGASTDAQFGFGIESDWMYSGCEFNNGIAVITSAGQLLSFNGGGFTELDNLPVYGTPYSWSSSNAIANSIGKVANRGMIAKGKNLYVNLDGTITLTNGIGWPSVYLESQPGGLWEYSEPKGFSHSAGYPYSKYSTITITAVNSSDIDCGTAHNCETGDAVFFNVTTGLTGVTSGQTYYAIKTGTNSMELALTPADAAAGKNLLITGTASSCSICVEKLDSIGSTYIVTPGAVALQNTVISNIFFGSQVLFGGVTHNASGGNASLLMSIGVGRNRGFVVTRKMMPNATTITEEFKNLYLAVFQLTQAVDSVRAKYRTSQPIGYATMTTPITWSSTTVFSATENSGVDLAGAVAGDEVTVVRGAGAGYAAHIYSIAQSGQAYTVTLDEAIPLITNGNTSDIIIDNWKFLNMVDTTSPFLGEGYGKFPVNKEGVWSQYKVEFRGSYLTFGRFLLATTPKKSLI